MTSSPSFVQRARTTLGRGGRTNGARVNVLYAVATLFVVESGYVHYHLWDTGYRHIPTIGPMFLLQSISAVVLAIVLLTVRRVWIAVLGALFLLSTVGGFLLSVGIGLFQFKDSWQAPYAGLAFTVEVVGSLVLATCATLSLRSRENHTP